MKRVPVCELCKKNEAAYAWQEELDALTTLGSHYRGFRVVKVCDCCAQTIRKESTR